MKDIQMSKLAGCCQAAVGLTPENSILDESAENELGNNNNMFHLAVPSEIDQLKAPLANEFEVSELTFSKRPKVDVEFQNVKYTVNRFSFQQRKFGELIFQ